MRRVVFCALCHSNLIFKIILKQLDYLHLKISKLASPVASHFPIFYASLFCGNLVIA